jgi:hypothetical protein
VGISWVCRRGRARQAHPHIPRARAARKAQDGPGPAARPALARPGVGGTFLVLGRTTTDAGAAPVTDRHVAPQPGPHPPLYPSGTGPGASKGGTVLATAEPPVRNEPRNLISTALFGRLVRRIVAEEDTDPAMAERIMSQTLAFLKACADNPGAGLSPSPTVDIGWHTFVLHTREYAVFCDQVAGRFIHHEPTDDHKCNGAPPPEGGSTTATLEAMRASGLPVDEQLWRARTGECSQCHQGCVDSN